MTKKEAKEIMCKVTFYWELGEQTLTQNQINEAIDLAIKALEQQPCEDAISRQAVLEVQIKYAEHMGATKYWQMRDDIKALPSVTPTRPTGYWYINERHESNSKVTCSNCDQSIFKYHKLDFDYRPKFCPNCGARMAESEDKE